MQKILVLATENDHLRCRKCSNRYCESGDQVLDATVVIGQYPHVIEIKDEPVSDYPTPLHALGDGWRLMAPPVRKNDGVFFEWWFEKCSQ